MGDEGVGELAGLLLPLQHLIRLVVTVLHLLSWSLLQVPSPPMVDTSVSCHPASSSSSIPSSPSSIKSPPPPGPCTLRPRPARGPGEAIGPVTLFGAYWEDFWPRPFDESCLDRVGGPESVVSIRLSTHLCNQESESK